MKWIRRYSVLFVLLGLSLLLALISPRFMRTGNLVNIVLQSSITAMVALGLSFPILIGGIDLSVGSVVAFAGALSAGLATQIGLGTGWAIFIALGAGAFAGFLTGALVVWGMLPPFVASLSLMAVARGLTLVYTEGKSIAGLPENYVVLGSGSLGPIPMPVIFLILLFFLTHLILTRTRYGHHVYAVGGNVETARLAGIRVRTITLSAYVISALTASFAGILLTARLWSAQPTAGTGLELEAIAAVVLGGTSLMGGSGSAGGPVAGALIMGVIGNGLNLLKIPSYLQQVIKGVILILAVMIDIHSRRDKRRSYDS